MKKLIILTTLFSFLWAYGQALALALPLPNGPFYGDYVNLEWINTDQDDLTSPGQEDNWGIALLGWYDQAIIDPITGGFSPVNASSDPTWGNGDFGKELTAIFYDIDVVEFNLTSGTLLNGNYTLNSIGGKMDIWLNDAGSLDYGAAAATDRIGSSGGLFDGITNQPNSELWLSLEFVAYDAGGGTDYSIYGGGQSGNAFNINYADSYLSVTGGTMAQYFDTNYWTLTKADGSTVTADFHNKNSFDAFNARGWNANSEDPIEGFVVPEPTTVALFGLGLLGLASIGRRRQHI